MSRTSKHITSKALKKEKYLYMSKKSKLIKYEMTNEIRKYKNLSKGVN